MNRIKEAISKNKRYAIFGLSIIFGRGLEYLVVFYAAFSLSKEMYGELEFYKKIIEILAVFFAFGLPSLLLTYTKSEASKVYFSILSFLFIIILGIVSLPFLYFSGYLFLLIPVLFYAIFLNNGIMPVYFLTTKGSNTSAIYKSVISFLFYTGVFLLLVYGFRPQYSFIDINYFILPLALIYIIKNFISYKLSYSDFKKYFTLFRKMLLNTLTLVVSNFANIMFLYTDILIIKMISKTPSTDIADFSFVLNIANMLILIPLTMVQVDIEEIKTSKNLKNLNKKIIKYTLGFLTIIILGYLTLINTYYADYKSTLYLFFIILTAKFFQSQSVLYGSSIIIRKKYRLNLCINILVLLANLVLSIFMFKAVGLIGIAIAGLISLLSRYLILRHYARQP